MRAFTSPREERGEGVIRLQGLKSYTGAREIQMWWSSQRQPLVWRQGERADCSRSGPEIGPVDAVLY